MERSKRGIPFWLRLGIGHEDDQFIENLSLLLASGTDVIASLSALKKEARSEGMKLAISQMMQQIESGSTLSTAMRQSGLFGENVLSLIEIGEQSGNLSENLKVTAEQMEKERIFKSKITSAMLYPAFVLSLTVIVGISISWFLLPRLGLIFGQVDLELPLITRILIDVGVFLSDYGIVVVPVTILTVILLVAVLFFLPSTRFIGQELIFALPGATELISQIELSRFGFILGSLLKAGLPVVDSFNSLISVTTFRSYRDFYIFIRDRINEGNSFDKSFELYKNSDKLIPPSVQGLIVAAEQSGYLSAALIKIGERYEERSDMAAKNLSTILEPVLLVIVALGVLGVAIAVILPIYSLVGNFTQMR